jgi:hypothetical protein
MSWIEQFSLSGWAKLLNGLDPHGFNIDIVGQDYDFEWSAAILPIIILVLGVVLAVIIMIRLCCCSPKLTGRRGRSLALPIMWGVLCIGLIVLGLILFENTSQSGWKVATDMYDSGTADADETSTIISNVQSVCSNMQSNVTEIQSISSQCVQDPQVKAALDKQLQDANSALAEVSKQMDSVSTAIRPIVDGLHKTSRSKLGKGAAVITVCFLLPIIFVGLGCIFYLFVVFGTACMKPGSCCAKCEDLVFIKLGSVGLAVAIIVVTAVTAAELASGIGLSSFCYDVDSNMVEVLNVTIGDNSSWGKDNGLTAFDTSVYYITGQGTNPLMDQLDAANESLASLQSKVELLSQATAMTSPDCQAKFQAPMQSLSSGTADGQAEVLAAQGLLEPSNVYPYYQQAVHQQLCSTVIDGLAWLSLFQTAVGLICLPFLSCTVASFVQRRAHERLSEHAREHQEPLAQQTNVVLA